MYSVLQITVDSENQEVEGGINGQIVEALKRVHIVSEIINIECQKLFGEQNYQIKVYTQGGGNDFSDRSQTPKHMKFSINVSKSFKTKWKKEWPETREAIRQKVMDTLGTDIGGIEEENDQSEAAVSL